MSTRRDARILDDIRDGCGIDALIDRWPLVDVVATMRHHNLTVAEDGTVSRNAAIGAGSAAMRLDLVELASRSLNPEVREAAQEAAERQARLLDVLRAEWVRKHPDEWLEIQIAAVTRWRDWLRDAQKAASADLVRLTNRRRMRRLRSQGSAEQRREATA